MTVKHSFVNDEDPHVNVVTGVLNPYETMTTWRRTEPSWRTPVDARLINYFGKHALSGGIRGL